MFKLPLSFHIKQGNQNLLLWVKRANLRLDSAAENAISSAIQTSITSWLATWTGDQDFTHDSASDIISWSNTDAERDKSCADTSLTGESKLEVVSQLVDKTNVTHSTE
jgi:hypothetical protein